jgi:LAO/AO transport system kinase
VHDNIKHLFTRIKAGDQLALAKGITLIQNELPDYKSLLYQLQDTKEVRVIGITGPPGAGKSSLVNALLHYWLQQNKKIAVIAVDPSSPFNHGALLGDRIRMSDFYTHPNVFIRSLASRGTLGGLSANIIEITDLVKNAPFDYVIVETVGVGQSEVDIAGLADCTIVTLVPEAGDEVQTLKAGIMEIADIFVVNKADRDAAEALYRHLRALAHENAGSKEETPVIKTIATAQEGIEELATSIDNFLALHKDFTQKRLRLLAEKCWQLIQTERMKSIDAKKLETELQSALQQPGFNIYSFAKIFEENNT